jgi:hypothetical protein
MQWTAVLVVLCVMCGSVQADVASPRARWTTVQMQSEQVNITLGQSRVMVEATFVMHNTGQNQSVKMGYPLGLLEDELRDFAASVDGQPITNITKETPGARGAPAGIRPPSRFGGGGESYRFAGPYKQWQVFQVPMKAGEHRTVKVNYWVTPATIKDASLGEVGCYTYTLRTGATWKGKIEQAVVNVQLNGLQPEHVLKTTSGAIKSGDGRMISWTFRDFKPTDDIALVFRK